MTHVALAAALALSQTQTRVPSILPMARATADAQNVALVRGRVVVWTPGVQAPPFPGMPTPEPTLAPISGWTAGVARARRAASALARTQREERAKRNPARLFALFARIWTSAQTPGTMRRPAASVSLSLATLGTEF